MSHELLKITNLNYTVDNKEILKNISFTVDTGDLITISGPSGSGKSTLLKLIANMIEKTSGEIIFDDKKMEDYSPTIYRQEISYFFQNPVLFDQTVKDNLIFPYTIRQLPFDETHAVNLLEEVKLSKDYLNKTIESLSGGEKQRIAFVRNLLFQPRILLLDEVTSALDQENSDIIYQIIKKLNQNNQMTILWITHNQNEYLSSNKRLFVEKGGLKNE